MHEDLNELPPEKIKPQDYGLRLLFADQHKHDMKGLNWIIKQGGGLLTMQDPAKYLHRWYHKS